MRKTISLVLAGVLALALLPGFGKDENTASVLTKEQEQLLQTEKTLSCSLSWKFRIDSQVTGPALKGS